MFLLLFFHYLKREITRRSQSKIFFIKHDTSPRVGGCIGFLLVAEHISLPIRQLLRLADFLSEKIGIEFLEAFVIYAQLLHVILQVDEQARGEIAPLVQ